MNPFLSQTGRIVLFSALVFTIAGAAMTNVSLVVLGQAQVVLLAVAFLLISPSALALDRRLIRTRLETADPSRATTGHIIGSKVELKVSIENLSDQPIHNMRLVPFGAESLVVTDVVVGAVLDPTSAVSREIELTSEAAGRWALHGFDVQINDPLGFAESRDYLPCTHAFEFYPTATSRRRGRSRRRPQSYVAGLHVADQRGSGTELRQLRDYRPGDSLRDIAWKSTLRSRRLVAREYEQEVSASVYFAVDASSSMRGGSRAGQKLDWAIDYAIERASALLDKRDRVGVATFDEKMVGHIAPQSSKGQLQRIVHHLVGLNSIVDEDLTELDETELERLAADYLLVQERLDFRRGASNSLSGVNRRLLDRWVGTKLLRARKRLDSGVLREGALDIEMSPLREFLRLRGLSIPYRVEARLGMKERGLVQTLEQIARTASRRHRVVVISDLCAIMNAESIARGVNLLRAEGHQVEFVVPFTPWFYEPTPDHPRYEIVRELFTSAEAEERSRVVRRIRALDVPVTIAGP